MPAERADRGQATEPPGGVLRQRGGNRTEWLCGAGLPGCVSSEGEITDPVPSRANPCLCPQPTCHDLGLDGEAHRPHFSFPFSLLQPQGGEAGAGVWGDAPALHILLARQTMKAAGAPAGGRGRARGSHWDSLGGVFPTSPKVRRGRAVPSRAGPLCSAARPVRPGLRGRGWMGGDTQG